MKYDYKAVEAKWQNLIYIVTQKKAMGKEKMIRQHRIIPALRFKHRSGGCGTASALPKCSIIHKVLSSILAWHLPHLARRIGT